MEFKINDTSITKPKTLTVDIEDIEDSSSSMMMADGSYARDIVATKRVLKIEFDTLSWGNCSQIMTLLSNPFISIYYPDPLSGQYETKEFYVTNKSVPFTTISNGEMFWQGLSINLRER